MHTTSLLNKNALVSDQVSSSELKIILIELEQLLIQKRIGSVVEMGCYVGTTSLFIKRLIDIYEQNTPFHVYDSFQGLPEKTSLDVSPLGTQFTKGELLAAKRDFILNFKRANVPLPIIHKAWFSDLQPIDIPDEIMYAYLDGDYYESIRDCLQAITSKLQAHSVIVVDDYVNDALPGTAQAVDDWLRSRRHSLHVIDSLAVIHLQ